MGRVLVRTACRMNVGVIMSIEGGIKLLELRMRGVTPPLPHTFHGAVLNREDRFLFVFRSS